MLDYVLAAQWSFAVGSERFVLPKRLFKDTVGCFHSRSLMFSVDGTNAMDLQPAGDLAPAASRAHRRKRNVAATVALALVCSGVTSCSNTQIGLSVTAIAAVLVGTTVGVTLAVQHSHHTLQGCIVPSGDGLELRLGAC